MSMLSEKLKEIIRKKQIQMSALANLCDIDRATLYKYIKGERKVNAEAFQQLMEGLRLSPEERAELQTYYNIAEMGEEDYLRRKNTSEFLSGFLHKAQEASAGALPPRGQAQPMREGVLYGGLEINRTVWSAVHTEIEKENGRIDLMVQPEYDFLFQLLPMLAWERKSCTVRHILCLEATEKNGDNQYNLSCLKTVMQTLSADCDYVPHYYYDNVAAHFSNNNLLPYLVVTGDCAIQISRGMEYAVCHTGKEYVSFFRELFEKALQKTQPFCSKIHTVPENLAFYVQVALNEESPQYGCSAEPCFVPYLSRDMLERHVNWEIPGMKALVDQLMGYVHGMRKSWGKQNMLIDYFTLEGLDYFCDTGRFWQIPDFACAPLGPRDRYEMLRRYDTMWSDSRVHLMYRPCMPGLPIEMETLAYRDGKVSFMQGHANNTYTAFTLREKSLSFCFEDLLSFLEKSGGTYTQEETRAILQRKMEVLKSQF